MKHYSVVLLIILLFCIFSCTRDEDPAPIIPKETVELIEDQVKPILLFYDFSFDSIKLSFNEPIKLLFIKSTNVNYDLLILNEPSLVKYSVDSTSIKFRCIPCQLGHDYELEYAIKDTAENENRQPFVVNYYSGRLKFSGRISDYIIDDEHNLGYVLSQVPDANKLSVISLSSSRILHEISLDFLPAIEITWGKLWRVVRNPSNGYLYFCSPFSKSIFVYSLEQESLVKTFELPLENTVEPEYSSVYPRDIAFTASGTGLIICLNQWGNGELLRTIDSTKGDTTSVVGRMDAGLMFAIRPNGDYSKIFIISEHEPFYYLDDKTNTLSHFSPGYVETNFTFFVPNRKNDLVYMSGHQAQLIIDHVSQARSASSYLGLPDAADFSYAPGEERDFAYLVDNSKLWLLNYKESKTELGLMIYDIANVESLVNTIDGQTMIIQHREALYLINLPKLRRKNL